MIDERKNLPSASKIERLELCPGSFWMEPQAPVEPETEEMISGTEIHDALKLRNLSLLNPEQTELAKACIRIERDFIFRNNLVDAKRYSERRIFLHEGNTANRVFSTIPIMSGKSDLFLHDSESSTVAVIDWKSGRTPVTAARVNWQIKSEIIGLLELFDFDFAFGLIVQPLVDSGYTEHLFHKTEFPKMEVLLREILRRAMEPDAPRIPGPKQCQYCRAKSICPEANTKALVPLDWKNVPVAGQQLAKEIPLYDLIEEIIESRRDLARRLLEASPNSIPGYKLQEGKDPDFIEDAVAAADKLSLTAEEILTCCKLSVVKLRQLWRRKNKLSERDSKEAIRFALAGILQNKKQKPSIQKIT